MHGNLRFLGRLHRLKSLTLKGIHIDDAGELAHLASSSHSAAAVAAGEGGDHADRVCSTGLHTLNLKRCTFSGAAAARSLLRAVGCLHGLRELSMGQTNLSGVDAASLRVLATLAHLRMLDLHWVSAFGRPWGAVPANARWPAGCVHARRCCPSHTRPHAHCAGV